MESIQNIADESSDEEGFEIDESAIDAVVEEQDDEEEPEEPSTSAEIEHERSTSSSSSSNRNSEETDSVDEFAQARKVPLSHHVINTPPTVDFVQEIPCNYCTANLKESESLQLRISQNMISLCNAPSTCNNRTLFIALHLIS